MGLFGLFQKKGSDHKKKVAGIYQQFKDGPGVMFLPGGEAQVDIIIRSLADIYGIPLQGCSKAVYDQIFGSYMDVVIRLRIAGGDETSCFHCLMNKHGTLVKNEQAARRAVIYCMMNMIDWHEVADGPVSYRKLDAVAATRFPAEHVPQGPARTAADPEYGLVAHKPVPTGSIPGSRQFLGRLRTMDGQSLQWERKGSTHAPGVDGVIDIYVGYTPGGRQYGPVYVNIYDKNLNNLIPAGFRAG